MTTVTEPNGSTVTSVYDADSELTDTTDQDGRRTTYAYDKDGDQTGESWVNGSGTAIYIATYTYDADHEMTGATDPYATLTFTYDKDGRVVTMATSGPGTGQPTVTLTYSYDQLGDETERDRQLVDPGRDQLYLQCRSAGHGDHAIVRRDGRSAGDVRLRQREPADVDLAADRHQQHGDRGEHGDRLRCRQPGRDHDRWSGDLLVSSAAAAGPPRRWRPRSTATTTPAA